ncbi:MAG: type II secretion system F family protein [Parcubacteria group bacterium]|nr:type II secretion system F family protein [Parcubacteria group bacterium]
MKYLYKAISRAGKTVQGMVEARSKEEAEMRLRDKNLAGIELSYDWRGVLDEWMHAGIGWVTDVDKLLFMKHLSVMMKAHLVLDEAIFILKDQTESLKLKRVLERVAHGIENGKPLSDNLEQFPAIFTSLEVNIIRAGEKAGTLDQSLENLALHLAKSYELKQRIKGALFYPILVLALAGGLGLFLTAVVLPRITRLFTSLNVQLPLPTRILIGLGSFVQNYGFYALILGIIIAAGLIFLFRLEKLRYPIHESLLKLPVFGKLIKDFNLGLLARTLGTLLRSGVPIVEAVHITSQTFSNRVFSVRLQETEADIQKGVGLAISLEKYPDLYPPILYRMVAIGEETGELEGVLFYLADFFESEVDNRAKNLSTLLEPILLIFIGLVVAGIAVAIIMPIYQITGSLRR